MRKNKLLMAALAAVMVSVSANAQDDGSREPVPREKNQVITNGAASNWFVGAGVGINSSFGKGIQLMKEFSLSDNLGAEAFIGKWFTPQVGFRVGYKGLKDNFGYDNAKYYSRSYKTGEQIKYNSFHCDFIWNISNTLCGYRSDRFWDFIPYFSGGFISLKTKGEPDYKFVAGVGLYNKLHLSRLINLYIDLNLSGTENPVHLRKVENDKSVVNKSTPLLSHPAYLPSATVGISINLGKKKSFDPAGAASNGPSDDEYNNLKDRLAALEDKNNALENENNALNDSLAKANDKLAEQPAVQEVTPVAPVQEVTPADNKDKAPVANAKITPLTVYFNLNKAELSDIEMAHLEEWLELQSEETRETPISITGSADSTTGTAEYNTQLAEKRANAVRDYLMAHGFKNVSVKGVIDGSHGSTSARNRAAKIE